MQADDLSVGQGSDLDEIAELVHHPEPPPADLLHRGPDPARQRVGDATGVADLGQEAAALPPQADPPGPTAAPAVTGSPGFCEGASKGMAEGAGVDAPPPPCMSAPP